MQIFDFYCSIVLKLLSVKNLNIYVQQLNIIVSEKVILTVFESPYSGLEQLKMHIQDKPITQMDTLLYGILDAVLDDYNLVFDEWSTHVDKIEEELLDSNDKSHMKLLQSFKKQLFLVYRSISPLRDVLSRIAHNEIEFMSDVIALYHRDILDHLIQVLDEVDLYRETLNTMVEVYLSSVSNRTNDIMRVLTIISTVFIPLTFIVGLYGMNFDYMPELKQPYGYPIVIVVMIAITVGLIAYFKRKNWF
jgi:magnesium transporter